MKKQILIFSVTAITLMACSKSLEEKVQESVRTYLMKNLDDPKSYESVEFGKIDSVKGLGDKEVKEYSNAMDSIYEIGSERTLMDTDKYYISSPSLYDSLKVLSDSLRKKSLDSLNVKYPFNNFLGYKITHKFRGKNKMGATVLQEYKFRLDTNLTVIKMTETKE